MSRHLMICQIEDAGQERNRLPELKTLKTDATNSPSVPSSKSAQNHTFSVYTLAIFIASLVLRQHIAEEL